MSQGAGQGGRSSRGQGQGEPWTERVTESPPPPGLPCRVERLDLPLGTAGRIEGVMPCLATRDGAQHAVVLARCQVVAVMVIPCVGGYEK